MRGGSGRHACPHRRERQTGARGLSKGTYTWFGLRIYDAELWVGDKGYAGDAPYALDLRYAQTGRRQDRRGQRRRNGKAGRLSTWRPACCLAGAHEGDLPGRERRHPHQRRVPARQPSALLP
ncbi:hypothetical protein LP420_12140 [Massilia sp. B-10]|nr:hypothetical protein LP420_12140 [Massilia sp. B-10]